MTRSDKTHPKKDRPIQERIDRSFDTQGSKKVWNYFLDLIKTEKFQRQIADFRKEIKEGANYFYDIYDRMIFMATEYGLDGVLWEDTLQDYIYENKLTRPTGIDMCKVVNLIDLKELFSCLEDKNESFLSNPLEDFNTIAIIYNNFPVAILINPNASLRDILDFVTKNYDLKISNSQEIFKSNKSLSLGKSRNKKDMVQQRNEFIYQNRNLPRKEIMHLVTDKFGSDNTVDYGYVGKIISLETKKRKEV